MSVYRQRTGEAMDVLAADGRRVYWIGNPIMREEGYRQRIAMMNGLYEDEAPKHPGVTYVDTWKVLAAADGRFADCLRADGGRLTRVRGAEGIHLTRAGGDWVASRVLAVIARDWSVEETSQDQ